MVWPLYLNGGLRHLHPAQQRLLLFYFFTAFTMFLADVVFLGGPIQCLIVSTQLASFCFRTIQIVVLAMPDACALALIACPSFSRFKMA